MFISNKSNTIVHSNNDTAAFLLPELSPQQPSRRDCSILISYQEKASGSKHLPKVAQPASKWDLEFESSHLGRGACVLGPLPPPVALPTLRTSGAEPGGRQWVSHRAQGPLSVPDPADTFPFLIQTLPGFSLPPAVLCSTWSPPTPAHTHTHAQTHTCHLSVGISVLGFGHCCLCV